MPDTSDPLKWPRYRSHKIVHAARIIRVEAGAVLVDAGDGPSSQRIAPSELKMLVHAEVDGYAVLYLDGRDWISIWPKEAFEEGYRPYDGTPVTPVLMSADNPAGWKLEDLLHQIQVELALKTDRLAADKHPIARALRDSNGRIAALLKTAEGHQRQGLDLLDTIGPDQGPRGKPRVGTGS